MRLDRKAIHPAILSVYEGFDPNHGVGRRQLGLQLAGSIFGIALGLFLFAQNSGVLVAVFTVLAISTLSWFGFSGNRSAASSDIDVESLDSVFENLEVEETWKAYVDTLTALSEIRHTNGIEETVEALNELLTEEANLHRTQEKLAALQKNLESERIVTERETVVARLANTQSPATKQALAQSLALIDERLAGQALYRESSEHLVAQLALIKQTIFATRDAAQRLHSLPTVTNTDRLRSVVAQARVQTQATEQALAELNAM